MTNLGGLALLFVALGLFTICVALTMVLVGILAWDRWSGGTRGRANRTLSNAIATIAIGMSGLSWIYMLYFSTPSGIVDRLLDRNPVLFILLLGMTLPAILGGYVLREFSDPRD